MNIIELKNVKKVYGEKDFKVIALNNINLNIKKGDFIAIMGVSGSGKSTLLNILGCMDIPTEGEYYLNGSLVNKLKNKDLSKIRNSTISFVFQHFALMKEYSIYENVELPLTHRNISNKKKQEIIMSCLEKLGIKDQANKKPSQLSGGQQQRAAIARALVSDAEIILADEPTGSLDTQTGNEIMNLISEINKQGKTVIIVTHDKNVASYCNKKIIIRDGNIELEEYLR